MGLIVRESFPVRGNEIGFAGVVPPGTLSRYGEWARWAMFRDPSFALREKFPSGVARAQTVELVSDFTYPSDCVVTTFVARVGRTSLDFGHELATEDGTLVARLRVTIVGLGPTGPIAFPPELAEHVSARPAPTPIPHAGEPPADAFVYSFVARPSDQDQFRHVNQARYVDFADDVRLLAARSGHPAGFEGPLGRVTVSYEREVHGGETVEVRIWPTGDGARAIEMRNGSNGRVVNRATVVPRTGA
ncbi:MAG: acyl-CoA thioesterase [Polyangiales bacterium]